MTPHHALTVRVVAASDSFDMLALMLDLEQIDGQVKHLEVQQLTAVPEHPCEVWGFELEVYKRTAC